MIMTDGTKMLGSCDYFQVKEILLSDKAKEFVCDEKSYNALIQTSGESIVEYKNKEMKINAGECVFIPAGFGEYNIKGNGIILMATNKPRYFAGVDLGETNIAVAIVDENGVTYGKSEKKTNISRQYNEIFDDVAACVKEATENSGLSMDDIEAIGIGLLGANNIKTDIVAYMEKATGKKVYASFGNDADIIGAALLWKNN